MQLPSVMTLLASIPSPPISGFEIGPLRVTFYGILIAIGVMLGWRLTVKRYEEKGGDPALAERILIWMVVIGFLGARLAYVSTHLSRFEGEWWKVLAIWEGGLALFGGLTAGALTVIILNRRWGGSLPLFLDSVAPAVPLAQAFGRWGNYFNQELFGTPTNLPWGLEIAPENRPEAYPDATTFHPTFLYESIWNLGLSALIIWLDKRVPSLRGRLIGVYLIGYAAMRFALELIRTDTTFRFWGLSRNAWVSLVVVVIGTLVLIWKPRQKDDVDSSSLPEKV
jgi:prolipoprotein diacylglyceryl transferase